MSTAFVAGRFTARGRPDQIRETATPAEFTRSAADELDANRAALVGIGSDGDYLEGLKAIGERPESEASYDDALKFLLKWVGVDPLSALEYVRAHYDPRHRNAFLSSLLAAWAGKDAAAAWAWTTQNLPGDHTQYDAVLSTIGRSDPETAWRYATEAADKEGRPHDQSVYVSALRGIIYAGQYEQAAGLIANLSLGPGEETYDMTGFLAGEWARYDPAKALAWATQLPGDGSLSRQQALVNLGISWARSDPQAVADFALQLPPGVTRLNLLSTALDSWITDHPDQVATWLNQNQPNGFDPDFNLVLMSLASSSKIVDANHNLAICWANAIDDDVARIQALNRIMTRWMATDAMSAESYLDTTADLSPQDIAQLRRNLNISH